MSDKTKAKETSVEELLRGATEGLPGMDKMMAGLTMFQQAQAEMMRAEEERLEQALAMIRSGKRLKAEDLGVPNPQPMPPPVPNPDPTGTVPPNPNPAPAAAGIDTEAFGKFQTQVVETLTSMHARIEEIAGVTKGLAEAMLEIRKAQTGGQT